MCVDVWGCSGYCNVILAVATDITNEFKHGITINTLFTRSHFTYLRDKWPQYIKSIEVCVRGCAGYLKFMFNPGLGISRVSRVSIVCAWMCGVVQVILNIF